MNLFTQESELHCLHAFGFLLVPNPTLDPRAGQIGRCGPWSSLAARLCRPKFATGLPCLTGGLVTTASPFN